MASPVVNVRLPPVIVAYLDELSKIGGYGTGRAGVIRRFVENGIVRAIEMKVIETRVAADFGDAESDENHD